MAAKKTPKKMTKPKKNGKGSRLALYGGQSTSNALTFSGGPDWSCYDPDLSTASASNINNLKGAGDTTTPVVCVVNSWLSAIPAGLPIVNVAITLSKVSDLDNSKEYVIDDSLYLTIDGGGSTGDDDLADIKDAWPKGGAPFNYGIANPECDGVPITTDHCLSGDFGFVLTAILQGTNPIKLDSISIQAAQITVSW